MPNSNNPCQYYKCKSTLILTGVCSAVGRMEAGMIMIMIMRYESNCVNDFYLFTLKLILTKLKIQLLLDPLNDVG